jgi:hypothetical protein
MWLALHRFVTSTIACPDLCLWCFDSRNRCGRSISAFGGSDGGKSIWENALRSSIERFQGQKPHLTTLETPLLSRPGASAPDQAIKQSNVKNKRKKKAMRLGIYTWRQLLAGVYIVDKTICLCPLRL